MTDTNGVTTKTKQERCMFSYPDFKVDETTKTNWKCLHEIGVERSVTKKYCDKCTYYISKYIEYPIQVASTTLTNITYESKNCGKFVKIRPCADEYKDKTYLGVYLGRLPLSLSDSYDIEKQEYAVSTYTNPAILVPDLNKIIFGCNSWWGFIKSVSDLEAITDKDIDNVWYVKALHGLIKGEQ